ncbi:deoxynucleoside kinase [Flammeovirga yaeyamensis]|uniref:Deoxynucleoside kinase n=1 Tax=Flammeovirga yaeyamensis TaxID=367791 RepID=A0AAX1N7A0_9BACT|nr:MULTISPECIES: deoxynucleoside kinase [Flammeovirga]ANQ50835.1 deoxynucleoside kinase [Flammeovirga sp. MY04]MBB3700780.1 deoxyadenosine/deoxycytidine kinase [Flammeovirga yaeyamensis]NMF37865.1 deoxynucleoside kinase [Flammeovirga yaeyamensis]QWG01773.1 deoxynucleoside kinase [Flammeovirga yaeyamensis]
MQYIAIAGNIGSGKTTLTKMLSEHFNWIPEFESTADNPYLEDFYNDMKRWAFHAQVRFLDNSFQQMLDLRNASKSIVQDRSFDENAHIFAKNLHTSGIMDDRDFESYWKLFKSMSSQLPKPDLLIYLDTDYDRLISQIQKRGRSYEQTIPEDYLKGLNVLYNQWIDQYTGPLLRIKMDDYDFVENTEDFYRIVNQIDEQLSVSK